MSKYAFSNDQDVAALCQQLGLSEGVQSLEIKIAQDDWVFVTATFPATKEQGEAIKKFALKYTAEEIQPLGSGSQNE